MRMIGIALVSQSLLFLHLKVLISMQNRQQTATSDTDIYAIYVLPTG